MNNEPSAFRERDALVGELCAVLETVKKYVAVAADKERWEEVQPDGPGTERGWFLNISETGCPIASDTAQDDLLRIEAVLSRIR